MCVLGVAKYGRNRLDITWYLMESIRISNACDCICTDLVGSRSMFPGCLTGGANDRFECDNPPYVVGVLRYKYNLQNKLADA